MIKLNLMDDGTTYDLHILRIQYNIYHIRDLPPRIPMLYASTKKHYK